MYENYILKTLNSNFILSSHCESCLSKKQKPSEPPNLKTFRRHEVHQPKCLKIWKILLGFINNY